MPSTQQPGSRRQPPASRRIIDATAAEVVEPAPVPFDLPYLADDDALPVLAEPRPRLRVGEDGGIRPENVEGDPHNGAPLAQVTPEVFAADMEAIRHAMHEAQRSGHFNANNQVSVDRAGNILVGRDGDNARPVSQVTPQVFASGRPSRAEARVIEQYFPAGTCHTSQLPNWPMGQPSGWIVETVSAAGDRFEYLCHWDPAAGQYRALLISPALEKHVGNDATPHDLHMYPNGTMCVTRNVGAESLQQLYAHAVLWCNGISEMLRRNIPFPFSEGQAPL